MRGYVVFSIILIVILLVALFFLLFQSPDFGFDPEEDDEFDFYDNDGSGYKLIYVRLRRKEDESREAWKDRKAKGLTKEINRVKKRYEAHGWKVIKTIPERRISNPLDLINTVRGEDRVDFHPERGSTRTTAYTLILKNKKNELGKNLNN